MGFSKDEPTDYARNLLNLKMTFPPASHWTEDQLSYLPYFLYYYSLRVSHALPKASHALSSMRSQMRAWLNVVSCVHGLWPPHPLFFYREWTKVRQSGWGPQHRSLLISAPRGRGALWGGRGAVRGLPFTLTSQVRRGGQRSAKALGQCQPLEIVLTGGPMHGPACGPQMVPYARSHGWVGVPGVILGLNI